jgi:hypothetical protein
MPLLQAGSTAFLTTNGSTDRFAADRTLRPVCRYTASVTLRTVFTRGAESVEYNEDIVVHVVARGGASPRAGLVITAIA